jgi:hypothetical protein
MAVSPVRTPASFAGQCGGINETAVMVGPTAVRVPREPDRNHFSSRLFFNGSRCMSHFYGLSMPSASIGWLFRPHMF